MKQVIELHACAVNDIPEAGAKKFCPAGKPAMALFRISGGVYATADACTHAEGSLSDGYVEGDVIVCPVHPGEFHIPTGKACSFPAEKDLCTFPVRIADGQVYIQIEVQA
ncbi:MAG: non-heme iron oxygenase ferredoxin subunit [Pseudomonadota bacterium]